MSAQRQRLPGRPSSSGQRLLVSPIPLPSATGDSKTTYRSASSGPAARCDHRQAAERTGNANACKVSKRQPDDLQKRRSSRVFPVHAGVCPSELAHIGPLDSSSLYTRGFVPRVPVGTPVHPVFPVHAGVCPDPRVRIVQGSVFPVHTGVCPRPSRWSAAAPRLPRIPPRVSAPRGAYSCRPLSCADGAGQPTYCRACPQAHPLQSGKQNSRSETWPYGLLNSMRWGFSHDVTKSSHLMPSLVRPDQQITVTSR